MKLLDWIGSGFVYRSPNPNEGFARFLETLPSRKLRALADTTTHYSKKKLVQIYLEKNALTKIPIKQSSQ
tara:strand:- start:134 stop:343 length:210 start_codon:yes stop_codon:yes gene_type:complete